jgi:hypothetical protein
MNAKKPETAEVEPYAGREVSKAAIWAVLYVDELSRFTRRPEGQIGGHLRFRKRSIRMFDLRFLHRSQLVRKGNEIWKK